MSGDDLWIDDSCSGQGRCYSTAPRVFEAKEDGRGRVRDDADIEGEASAIDLAILLCPESAIERADASSGT